MAEKLPSLMIERPKMPRATWDALRAHIVRERQRKKHKLEQSAEYERQKKLEREHKKKQEAQSLEETKEQITQLEKNLTNFKKDKHELFHTLKKVLFEDDTRRRSKEAPHPPQPQLYMQSAIRPPHGSVYMKPNPQLLITSQPAQPQPVKRPRSPSPTRSGIPAVYYRNALHPGPSSSRYPVTTAYSSVPTTAHSHYTSYPATALSHEQEEVARAAKHIYLSPAAAASQSQRQSMYNDRAALNPRSLAPPPAAHGAAHSAVTASNVAAAAAAAAGIHSRTGSLMARYNNFPPTTSYSAVTLASAISSSPRLAHSQNGTGPPGGPQQQQPNSRYYTNRD